MTLPNIDTIEKEYQKKATTQVILNFGFLSPRLPRAPTVFSIWSFFSRVSGARMEAAAFGDDAEDSVADGGAAAAAAAAVVVQGEAKVSTALSIESSG